MRRDAPSASILSRYPWLLDANAWTVESGPNEPASANDGGAWLLGNGWVFAHAGLRRPYNRLSGITGPTYQVGGVFGDCWLELRTERGPLESRTGQIGRPRESGVLVSAEGGRGQGAAVVSVDFAPPDNPVLIRLVEVWGGSRLGSGAALLVHLPGAVPHDERRRSIRKTAEGGQVLILAHAGPGRWAQDSRLEVQLEPIAAQGGVWLLPLVLAFGSDEADAVAWLRQPFDPLDLLHQTRSHHKVWLAHADTPDLWSQNLPGPTATTRAIGDLMETAKLNLRMQQALPGGAVCAMVNGGGSEASARDASGPIRAFLAMGARDDALDVLEYHYRAALVLGRIPPSVPIDLEVTGVGEQADWATVPVAPATGPAHIVLQHRWWLEAGGDPDVVRRHWPYLVRCLTGHPPNPECLWPFDGDEPYLHGGLYAVYPDRCGWPNDLIADDREGGYHTWSLDAAVLQAAAYRALGFMAGKIGQDQEADGYVQEARRISRAIDDRFWQADQGYYAPAVYPLTGARHQAPFAPVNLRPLWLGLPEAPDSRARSNVDAVADLIGFTGITPNCDYTIGAAPGYLLAGLVEAESDLAPVALANLAAMASPAGEWAELYGPGGLPCAGADAERPRRARPWETGINLDALYRYFRTRRAWQEPDTDFRGVTRRGRTYGPGPSRRFQAHDDDLAASRAAVVVVTAEPGEVAEARALPEARNGASLLVVEPGRILAPGFLQPLLFDQSHARAATVLMLGASALAGDRRSMKPGAFWRSRDLVEALERFQAAGGRVLRGA